MTARQQRARRRLGTFLAIVVIAAVGDSLGAFNSEPTPAPTSTETTHASTPEGACKNVDLPPCNAPIRERLLRAAEHLPAGASVEEMTEQAQAEAEAEEP